MKPLAAEFNAYQWAPSTEELARRAGLDPVEILRFDGNVPPLPLPSTRPAAIASALARVNEYAHGGYPRIHAAIAEYAGVEPENVVLGAGADDLLLLAGRAFAGPGDTVAIPQAPTYPLFRISAQLAGAEIGDADPALTFCCRPANPTGALDPIPDARPLVVDEAYFEYAEDPGAVGLIDDRVVVVRTFSKIFALASARIGYALASRDIAAELNARLAPEPVSTISVALALAALESPPDPAPVIEERERLADELRMRGYVPLESRANFLYVPVDDPLEIADRLLAAGCVVRVFDEAIRISVRDLEDDDVLLAALDRTEASNSLLQARRARHVRTTTETSLRVRLAVDGASRVRVSTGAGLYDHFLEQLAFHAGFDLVLEGGGDAETGEHHTAEDAAIALGEALDRALGTRTGIARYGDAVVPMDDARADAAIDVGGRRHTSIRIDPDPGLAQHVLGSFADNARIALHVESSGRDAHHTAEAAFKATGRALRVALRRESDVLPSTKGVL